MAADSYAQAELKHENWNERLRRVASETRELVVATRKIITLSHASLAQADETLKERL
jgi:hypothetical protein